MSLSDNLRRIARERVPTNALYLQDAEIRLLNCSFLLRLCAFCERAKPDAPKTIFYGSDSPDGYGVTALF